MGDTRCGLAKSGRRVGPEQVVGNDDWICVLPSHAGEMHCTPDGTWWYAPAVLDQPQEQRDFYLAEWSD